MCGGSFTSAGGGALRAAAVVASGVRLHHGTDPSPKARAAEEGGKAAVRRILAEELGQTVGWRRPD